MHIAILTAGGAGMFCGSCMHDNTLARALMAAGHEVSLIPAYTPIRLDEQDVSSQRIFLGGLNIYLDGLMPLWGRLPRGLTRWLDAPWLIRLLSGLAISPSARKLGKLTISLLEGDHGPQRKEIEELTGFLGRELRPDIICFSNALMAGVVPRLRQIYSGPVVCLLQGDDVFLNDLVEPYRTQSLELLRALAQQFDGFLTHSAYYCECMAELLHLPRERMHVVPLGIDLAGHDGQPKAESGSPFTIGYFARISPEKSLHQLVAAFRILHAKHPRTRLLAGGYLGPPNKPYFEKVRRDAADLGAACQYIGSPPDHVSKVAFLKSLDVLSVPAEYREPKGLYVLEALANGVPVVQPRHGAFPELVESTGGGLLVNPMDPADLARGLEELLMNSSLRFDLATRGRQAVHDRYNPHVMAHRTADVLAAMISAAAMPRMQTK